MKILPGVNLQFPISTLILSREKTIETRLYPLPEKYIGKPLYLIETPGKLGNFKARIPAVIVFGKSFQYENIIDFYRDIEKHKVDSKSPYSWGEKLKWGWPIMKLLHLKQTYLAPGRRGIVFTREINISLKL